MAAYINRTISLMAGDGSHNRTGILSNGSMRGGNASADSPLQIFVRAKKKINDIFVEIENYVKDTGDYIKNIDIEAQIVEDGKSKQIDEYLSKVRCIRDVLCRDNMKVAFFGRTSNGKSTVINAMLHDKILPSGIGHTTNCFLQVEGSDNNESYLTTKDSKEKLSVQSVGQLAHALCDTRLQENEMVRIFWPREMCNLLRDDVVLVDSPGVDVTPNLDEWIDTHCLDADVFVLVANSESTLMVTEKNFFHKVSTKISKPNIFILNNRWDASASEPEFLDEVRQQHATRCVEFLVKELKVCNSKEAEERIFFISAKEALLLRLREREQKPINSAVLADGFQKRYFEFEDFERKFQECISKSAVKTKFEQHSIRGKLVSGELRGILDQIYNKANSLRSDKLDQKKNLHEQLNYTEQQLMIITREMKEKIKLMVDDVEQRVSKALSEEIRRLSVLVGEFNQPFHPEHLVLNVYKKELHHHVESGLGSNLRARLSTALSMNIENAQHNMTDRMVCLLPSEKRDSMSGCVLPCREPFEVLYRLNCDNLCADFQEDLQFRFSWGITAMIQRFQGRNADRIAFRNFPHNSQVPMPLASPADSIDAMSLTNVAPLSNITIGPLTQEEWGIVSRIALASLTSQGTMGGLLLAGFMLKTVGWRIIAVTGAIYGAFYAYERMTWTNKAKERLFKKQYVAHVTRKLRLIVDLTSANCSHQVQQELSTTFARLCHLVDEANGEMDSQLHQLEASIQQLDNAATSAKKLRNKANYLTNELDMFDEAFLKTQH